MSNRVYDSAAGKKIEAYVIQNYGGVILAKVLALHGEGSTLVNVTHMFVPGMVGTVPEFQSSKEKGYGYNRFNHALEGLIICGREMKGHSGLEQLMDEYRVTKIL